MMSHLIWIYTVCKSNFFHFWLFKIAHVAHALLLFSARCRADEFQCRGDRSCISRAGYCNGIRECSDGSDEVGCRKYHTLIITGNMIRKVSCNGKIIHFVIYLVNF